LAATANTNGGVVVWGIHDKTHEITGLPLDKPDSMDKRGEGVPVILVESEKLSGIKPEYLLIGAAELRLTIFAARLP
jgi:hypothetical protein